MRQLRDAGVPQLDAVLQGNRERLRNLWRLDDPEASMIAWAWTRYPLTQARYHAAMRDPANAHLRFVRLTSRRAAGEWLASL